MTKAHDLSTEEQKTLISSILGDFADEADAEGLFAYLSHCGLPLEALRSTREIVPAFLALYRIRPGQYDVEGAFEDLLRWPPIAARLAYLQAEAKRKGSRRLAVATWENLTHDL